MSESVLLPAAAREASADWHEAEADRLDEDRKTMGEDAIPLEWSKNHRCDASSIRALADREK